VFVLPAYHKHALVEIRFRKFRNDLRSVNPKYDQLGAFNPLRVYRVFRAFIEIALAFEEPFLIDTALGVVSYLRRRYSLSLADMFG